MMLQELPVVPETVRLLTDPEVERVEEKYPFYIPSGPLPLRQCVTCAGKGDIRWWDAARSRVVSYRCDCRAQWLLHAAFLNANIETSHQRWSWDDAEGVERDARVFVLEYLDRAADHVRAGVGMFLHGDLGTGKTLMSVLALKKLVSLGYDGYFLTFKELVGIYREGWRDNEAKAWFERRVHKCKVLVIDDLNQKVPGHLEMVELLVDEILRKRMSAGYPTIITSNNNAEELGLKYGSNIRSLLAESMMTYTFSGEDWRMSEAASERLHREIDEGLQRPLVVG